MSENYYTFYNLWKRYLKVISHKETFGIGTLKAIADIFPLSSGIILSNDLAAPEDVGMMFWRAPLPSLHNYDENITIYQIIYCINILIVHILSYDVE